MVEFVMDAHVIEKEVRKLASIQKIVDIQPIEGADNIEVVTVLGWKCVVRKGEFKVGDLCVYFEVDSLLPVIPEFEFMAKSGIKHCISNGRDCSGYRLKSIRLKSQISQGLALPLTTFPELSDPIEGTNVSDMLNVTKYEKELPISMRGIAKGNFPMWFPKTDLVRLQTVPAVIERHRETRFVVQEKVDGQSISIYLYKGEFGVCSRNLELLESTEDQRWTIVRNLKIEEVMRKFTKNICIQGEFVGPKVQENRLKLSENKILFFDVFDIDAQRYYTPDDAYDMISLLGLDHVPVICPDFTYGDQDMEGFVSMVTTTSVVNPNVMLEGMAFKAKTNVLDRDLGRLVFKVINPEYLLKHGE